MDSILSNEDLIWYSMFTDMTIGMMALEALLPRREQKLGRSECWASNQGIVVTDTIVTRLLTLF